MRSGECEISEEGFVRRARVMFTNEPHRLVRKRIRVVVARRTIFGIAERRDACVVAREHRRIKVIPRSDNCAVEPIEAPLDRPTVLWTVRPDMRVLREVPLARHVSGITGGPQNFGNCQATLIQFPAITIVTSVPGHVANTSLMWIQTCEQSCSRGAATRRVVELREAQSILRERVEVGRLNLPTETTNVRVTNIVRENDDDVRARRGGVEFRDSEEKRDGSETMRNANKTSWIHLAVVKGQRQHRKPRRVSGSSSSPLFQAVKTSRACRVGILDRHITACTREIAVEQRTPVG